MSDASDANAGPRFAESSPGRWSPATNWLKRCGNRSLLRPDEVMIDHQNNTSRKYLLSRLIWASSWRQIDGPLFRKYVALFVAVVCIILLSNSLFEIGFAYRGLKASLIRIELEQAEAAAAKIGHFIKEIENQVGWT